MTLKIVSDLLLACDRGQLTLLALLHLSATFATVDHEILLDRLQRAFGIRSTALEWIEFFITGRVQTVIASPVRNQPSLTCHVVSHRAQGSVLGLMLFRYKLR